MKKYILKQTKEYLSYELGTIIFQYQCYRGIIESTINHYQLSKEVFSLGLMLTTNGEYLVSAHQI